MESTGHGLYRAEHRGLRELCAATRQLGVHWARLADRLGGLPATPLRRGAALSDELLDELIDRTRALGLEVTPAARGLGARAAGVRNHAGDVLLERNQAMRTAVLDAQHVSTLLGYLGALAATRGDDALADFHRRWEARVRELEQEAREAAVELGCDPAAAVVPAHHGAIGRMAHQVAVAMGSAGEAIDNSAVGRAARRFTRASG